MRLRDLVRERATWIYVALIAVMFHRPLTTDTFYFRDLYRHFYPKRVFFAEALRSGVFPFWDPMTHGGQPFLASPANYVFHPSNILYLLLPPIHAFNLVLVLHVLFCAIAAYWLARVLRMDPVAAFVCGSVFAFCGYTLSTANLVHLLLGLPWVPLTLGLLHRRTSLLPAAIAAAMPLYGGAAELTAMLFVTIVVIEVRSRAKAWAAAIVIFGAIGLSLPQTLPATSVIAQSARAETRTFDSFANWSVHPLRLPELVIPRFLGDLDSLNESDRWGRNLETAGYPYILSLYFGCGVLVLAGIGARGHRALAVLAVSGFLLSLGQSLPFIRTLYEHVPLLGIFRYPVKAQVIALLPLALLAGYGVERLARARLILLAASLAFGATAIGIYANDRFADAFANAFSFTALSPHHRLLLAGSLLHATLAALLLTFAAKRTRWVAAVIALDLLVAGYAVNDYAPRALLTSEPPLASQVRSVIGDGRFYSAKRPIVVPSAENDMMGLARWQLATLNSYNGALYGIPTVYHDDYDDLAPLRMSRASSLMEQLPWNLRMRLLERASVRAILTPATLPLPRIQDIGTLHLYAMQSLPRERFVSNTTVARNDRESLLHVLRFGDPSTVVVEGAHVRADRCGNAPVRVLSRSINSARYEIDAPCRGVVVFAENLYDGWTTRIDGAIAPQSHADYLFTAVEVDRGRHTIERTYFPARLWAGVVGALATLLALAIVDARSRQPQPSLPPS